MKIKLGDFCCCIFLLISIQILAQKDAQQLIDEGQYEQALQILPSADTLSQYLRLQALIRLGQFDEAEQVKAQSWDMQRLKGELRLNQGRYAEAQTIFDALRSTSEGKPDKQARLYGNLGILAWVSGKQQEAQIFLNQALTYAKSAYGPEHPQTAGAYNNLALITNDPTAAIRNYQQALDIYQKTYPEPHPAKASTLGNLGETYLQQKNLLNARLYLKEALQLWKDCYGPTHPNVAFAYTALARLELTQSKTDVAHALTQRALRIYQTRYTNAHPNLISTYNLLASINLTMGSYDAALQYLDSAQAANLPTPAAPFAQAISLDLLLTTLQLKGQAYTERHQKKTLRLRDLQAALQAYQNADQVLQLLRQSRSDEADKLNLGARTNALYDAATLLCLQLAEVSLKKQDYYQQAFQFSEKSKSSVLLAAIVNTKAQQYAGLPDSILQQEKKLRLQLTALERGIAQGIVDLHQQWLNTHKDYQNLVQRMEQEYPQYHALKHQIETITTDQVRQKLQPNQALISYQILEEQQRLVIFYLSAKHLKIKNQPIPEKIDQELRRFRNGIFFQVKEAHQESGRWLYRQLFPYRPPTQRIFIIPEGYLSNIPFEALQHKTESYLDEDYTISYAYSATLWGQSQTRFYPRGTALLCAPVSFTQMPTLTGTQIEIKKIDTLLQKNSYINTVNLFEDAHIRLFDDKNLDRFDFIHLATHGVINADAPDLSYLAMSQGKNLYAGALYGLRLNADLVTLSACQTGLGKLRAGEGLLGLSRALLFAGGRNLVVSLWSVADGSTAELMQTFYAQFLQNPSLDYGQAMQRARASLRASDDYSNPYHWAAFVVLGN
ncbi:MAG: CHAT domain-containing protein [Bernardetiaceae bacterium]